MSNSKEEPGYVDAKYLEALSDAGAHIKRRSYELMHIGLGQRVLDVSCGPGIDTIPLAEIVGEKGHVIGLDSDEEMIDIANSKANEVGASAVVKHDLGDAGNLPYESDYFDACRSERVLQHLVMADAALTEMVRVTKPGGWIVIVDTDHSTLSVDTTEIDIEWRLRRIHVDRLANGYAGRQLYRLLIKQKLLDVTVEVFPIYVTDYALGRYFAQMDEDEQSALAQGLLTQDELQRWHASLEGADKEGVFFGGANMVMVAGRKP